jgi:hypothetical protein
MIRELLGTETSQKLANPVVVVSNAADARLIPLFFSRIQKHDLAVTAFDVVRMGNNFERLIDIGKDNHELLRRAFGFDPKVSRFIRNRCGITSIG